MSFWSSLQFDPQNQEFSTINIFINLFMSGKREATYTIDPHTLEEKQKNSQPHAEPEQALPKQERKIFKIKRPGQSSAAENGSSKVSFKLNESQQIKPAQNSDKTSEKKEQEPKQKQAANPFANLFNNDKKEGNIFNGIGIFSNLKSTNLFTSNKGTEESSNKTANSNIFGGATIFAAKKDTLFDNSKNLKNTSASLFSATQQQNHDDEDGSGDSAELEKAQKIQNDPEKGTVQFSYQENCPVLLKLKVSKFKKSGNELIENVEIVLQKQKQTNIKYITVRLIATKKSIFSGILVEGRSEVKHIHGKKQNVEVSAFYKEKDTFAKTLLKFQFELAEDGEKLFQRLQELVAPAKEDNSTSNK